MGTAVLFLIALDALILLGPYGQGRQLVATIVTLAVAATILLIWVRNTRLERAAREGGKARPKTTGR